ncbi:DUF2585 family protein [Falsirhodobacter algicola]|uniref:DUF2585 family protein n=1 Tax=Falsirhodobacter algicola TaxID=2692330 RepID=A0A8J8MV91_9RHOB|nr:DUF2585 family protein [Falsirhodobacter algicola]QUS37325.1 DUF2585 family protein [Falsirhodobacter algicola]
MLNMKVFRSLWRLPAPVLMIALVLLQAGVLALMGRDPGCGCGGDWPWQVRLDPAQNSQHLADPYSVLHLGFGMALLLIFRALRPHWPVARLALIVLVSSSIWEVMENMPAIISVFGYEPGDPRGYDGDSILNSLGDTAFTVAGGMLASRLPVWAVVAALIAVEVGVSLWIDDGYIIGLLRALGLG